VRDSILGSRARKQDAIPAPIAYEQFPSPTARRPPRIGWVLRATTMLISCGALAGCKLVVMDPSGDVAVQERNLIIASTALMLLVIIPVIALTFLFARHYRASNPDAVYDPGFHHSTQLEVVIWTIPLLIIIALGAMAWVSTHTLDPFRPLSRLGPKRPVPADSKPLEVQVVSLDWKWLFIYPEQGVASVNEMAAPVDRPLAFKLTSSSVWNTFYVPALAGMIYTMPGMETQLQAVMNREGDYRGLSGHYSGSGFSRMNFSFRGVSAQGFEEWVTQAKASQDTLDRNAYLALEKPSEGDPVRYYGTVESGLYRVIIGMCPENGQMCIAEMHHIDRMGGDEKNSQENAKRLDYDNRRLESGTEPSGATFPASGRPPQGPVQPQGMKPRDQGAAGGGINQPKHALPGATGGPASPQLNTGPSNGDSH
jgi:cytochrome o ubiquinol oxidase subunit II